MPDRAVGHGAGVAAARADGGPRRPLAARPLALRLTDAAFALDVDAGARLAGPRLKWRKFSGTTTRAETRRVAGVVGGARGRPWRPIVWVEAVGGAGEAALAPDNERLRCADSHRTGRGATAAATWIFRLEESRRRRGRDVANLP